MLATVSLGLPTPCGLPTTVIAGQERHDAVISPSVSVPLSRSINPRQGRRTKTFVDPCEIAPLKKRRIQVRVYCQRSHCLECSLLYPHASTQVAIYLNSCSRSQLQYLSPDERDKVLHKREKNKVAAEKCRVKRREKVQQVRVEYEECLEANESLQSEIRRLREEEEKLEHLLKHHSCVAKQKV